MGYLFHYINNLDKYVGEKYRFKEHTLEELTKVADSFYKKESKSVKIKYWYHYAMIKAIEKYGYDNIPEDVVKVINDLHDLKCTFEEVADKI